MPRRGRTTSTPASTVLIGVALPPAANTTAHADPGSTIYVSQAPMLPACSDTAADAGSQATPFCSLQLAVDKVQPGQTVLVNFGQTLRLRVNGNGGVPDAAGTTVTAVTLNLTATGATGGGYVTAYADGSITLQNDSGYVDLTVGLQGTYDNEEIGELVPLPAQRALDTRYGVGAPRAHVGAYGIVTLKVAGVDGVPVNADAVLVNLTALNATQGSYVTAYANGLNRPNTANVYVDSGCDATDLAVVPIGMDGCIDIFNRAGNVDLLADVQGYFG